MRIPKPLCVAVAAAFSTCALAAENTLVGWAVLPADSFSDGPTSGQFVSANPYGTHLPPYADRQPVQGFSAVLPGADEHSFVVMTDNGFGNQANSGDTLLRLYSLRPDFRTADGGSGTVSATDYLAGTPLARPTHPSRLTLNDINQKLDVPLQADYAHYYDNPANPAVDESIRFGRLLTGADFDIESVRRDKNCALWFGDEFGPYLIKTDASGTVLRSEISLPGVYAPQHKDVVAGRAAANLGGSGGFEGMAVSPRGDRLYTLLEKTVSGDPAGTLRINEFDIDQERYTGVRYVYRLQDPSHAIGDMTAIDDTRFLVIERNNDTATSGVPFKKIYLIDTRRVASGGEVRKTELVDLMRIADPHDLNGDGSRLFTFPYVTIESVLPLDAWTLLVTNDNNFPGGGGRAREADASEFLKIRLASPIQGLRTAQRPNDPRSRCESPVRRDAQAS
ncbi:PEP-CTERM sorting domain-containing protein [Stutzerimonas nosocomialis]|uniref:PEP-CTERM sorting domain-containing protein n=1 Tax=Stutzerimonas nosocomialis TaxID=1056496 RepID=A0A5R9QF69_9GAMM|nr:esterase-like activity of phytase family protein [Stutzerimonas nosocomialis]TLX63640.1 PEP-CTERM sorting domain-containing protein [Stutzerimonas nosocomialis]